ncbi:MAG: DDE-type integrase/transposase/recombinase [Rhodobacteraceae bacterium]|nr:DDE-type integrase/transposase/recombinase [Paracoccaceae bacterium]
MARNTLAQPDRMEGRRVRCPIRCDNGPEKVSASLATWAEKCRIGLQFIQPRKPQQNAYFERYNRTVRYGWLN